MVPSAIWLLCLAAAGVRGQDTSLTVIEGDADAATTTSSVMSGDEANSTTSSATSTETFSDFSFTNSFTAVTGSVTSFEFTGTYASVTGQITQTTSTPSLNATLIGGNNTTSSTNSQITASTRSVSLTQIGGTAQATSTNGTSADSTASSTSSAAAPVNTVPCNGWPEFCTRRYSNITYITAHNAAFAVQNNAASNQELSIIDQLNDGIRMLQGQVHWVNETMYNCHSSCDLLNTGPWEDTLSIVRNWLEDNPYEVLTILIGNSDYTAVENFVPAITNAGLLPYVYTPEYVPQYRDQWPTLGEMILLNRRLVIFMDYDANQESVPYILDEFTHMWETPFSPTDPSFPCTQERPPDLNPVVARDQYMNLVNHNLNVAIDLSSLGISTGDDALLIPNTAQLNQTNGQQVGLFGTLGTACQNCTEMWDRAPNFLLVDYYNIGSPEAGSVFRVAAAANGVAHTRDCCGSDAVNSATPITRAASAALAGALLFTVLLVW